MFMADFSRISENEAIQVEWIYCFSVSMTQDGCPMHLVHIATTLLNCYVGLMACARLADNGRTRVH